MVTGFLTGDLLFCLRGCLRYHYVRETTLATYTESKALSLPASYLARIPVLRLARLAIPSKWDVSTEKSVSLVLYCFSFVGHYSERPWPAESCSLVAHHSKFDIDRQERVASASSHICLPN
jgi:hypothetical protein